MPATVVTISATIRTSQIEMWMPGASFWTPTEPKWNVTSSKCSDANHAAMYAPTA